MEAMGGNGSLVTFGAASSPLGLRCNGRKLDAMRGKASGKVSGTGELSSPPSSSNASKKRNIVLPPHKLSACVLIMLRPAHPDTVKKMRIMSQTDQWNGLKHFVRTPMSTSMDADFDTGNSRYKARERYSFGVSDPLGIFGSPGA